MKCLDKRVILTVGVLTLAMLAARPSWALAVLPLLIALLCPASMMLMMRRTPVTDRSKQTSEQAELARLRAQIKILKDQDNQSTVVPKNGGIPPR